MVPESEASKQSCSRCERQREYFYYMRETYKFDVDMAWTFAEDGREPVEVEEESVRISVEKCIINEGHVAHVEPQYPGLIAHVEYHEENGETIRGHLLIDGHHRAVRCLRENKPFYAYLLTEEESAAIVVRAPYLKKKSENSAGAMEAKESEAVAVA